MKTFTGAHPNRKRYRLARGRAAVSCYASLVGNARRGGKASRRHWRGGRPVRGRVAISGDTALIGGRLGDDVVEGVDSGSAYMFTDLLNGDHDGILNDLNNCPAVANPSQSDINPEGA